MPALRARFYSSLRQMRTLAQDPLLIDLLPPSDPHNVRARILRHGLTVSAFSSLEKYLEARTATVISALPTCGVSFAGFNADLQQLLSIDAVIGLANRINFREKSDRQIYTEAQLQLLSRYAATPAEFTVLGFSPRGSNVSENDISIALSAFGVVKPWAKLSSLAALIGSARLDLKNDYIALSRARHRSAHNPDSNVASADLETHLETTVLIAVTFDVICCTICKALIALPDFAALGARVAAAVPKIRFVDEESGGSWVERADSSSRVVKRYGAEDAAISGARARANVDAIIVRDTGRIPIAAA